MSKTRVKSIVQRTRNSQLARAIGVYTFLNFFLRGISFLITPLFTNYISPSEYGQLNVFMSSIFFVAPFIQISANSIIINYFKHTKEELSKEMSSYLSLSLGIVLLVAFSIFCFQSILVSYFRYDIYILMLIPVVCFFNLVIDIQFALYRNENKIMPLAYLTILKTVIELGLSVLLIMYLNKGSFGRIISLYISTGIIACVSFFYLYKRYKLKWDIDFNVIQTEYKFWIASLIGFLTVLSFTIFDKYIVKAYRSDIELGNYSLATQFGYIVLTFSSAISTAYLPNLYSDLTHNASRERIKNKISKIILTLMGGIIVCYFLVRFVYIYMINDKYSTSYYYVSCVMIVYGLWSMITILGGFISYFKFNRLNSYIGIASILVLIPIQIYTVKNYGILGLLISQIVYFIVEILVIIQYLKIKRVFLISNKHMTC